MKEFCQNIGILTFPISNAGNIPLSNLVDIIYPISKDTYLITGNDGYNLFKDNKKICVYGLKHKSGKNIISRIIKYILVQLKMSYILATKARNVDIWIFFMGGDALLIPMLTAKFFNKKVLLASAGSLYNSNKYLNNKFSKLTEILVNINRSLSNFIILYSNNLISELNLDKYKDKIFISHRHFLDFNKFKINKKFHKKNNFIGYIGRLSEEKGILNFIKSIPDILMDIDDLDFIIAGDGYLYDGINEYLTENKLNDRVKITGWIPHEELPDYLNELKLLILPSYTEGLPNIVLEAMACGVPVLTTPVGGITDIIKNEKTGFLLENNSPECIASNVKNVLENPNLGRIVKNAREYVEKEFIYESAVERYKNIFNKI